MIRSIKIATEIAYAVTQAASITFFIYSCPPDPLYIFLSPPLTDEELLWYQGCRQVWAILFFLYIFGMTFMPILLRYSVKQGDRSEHEDAQTTKVTISTNSTKLTKVESETNDTKEARTTKIEQSSEEVRETDDTSNVDEHVKTQVELVNVRTALEKEQERVNRMEQVMESLQAQVGVLRAVSRVKDAEARNKRSRAQSMEEDRQIQTDILATRIMTQEAKMEEVLERLDEHDSSNEILRVWIEKLKREAEKVQMKGERIDAIDGEINRMYDILEQEVRKMQEAENKKLKEFRTHMMAFEDYWTEELEKIYDRRGSRESDLKEEIRSQVRNDLRKEQELRESDGWQRRSAQEEVIKDDSMANQEAEDEMEGEVPNTVSSIEHSSQTDAENLETRVNQEVEVDMGGDKKQDAEMDDLEKGKNGGMEDITHELEDKAEVERKDGAVDEEWTELRY
ncbi:uncharacterized protein EAF01_007662 [Botrytis porri]|uniref:uncharacterized protein n=1 Tax=Botrytis porri TaxID=87229 RepID=UPI001902A1E1|nr:uncharacterized protein EAF01_007662 [Botrytis porri]KAF7900360.1 hypothetical protein EAF01_007662 [Botrytis porri]